MSIIGSLYPFHDYELSKIFDKLFYLTSSTNFEDYYEVDDIGEVIKPRKIETIYLSKEFSKTLTKTFLNQSIEDRKCWICLDTISNNIGFTECGHHTHLFCCEEYNKRFIDCGVCKSKIKIIKL